MGVALIATRIARAMDGLASWLPRRMHEESYPGDENGQLWGSAIFFNVLSKFGRGERIRTSDHLHPIQVRYQAALHPERTDHIGYGFPKSKLSCAFPARGDVCLKKKS